MRRILLAACLMAATTPAYATTNPCVTVDVDHGAQGVEVEAASWTEGAPRSALVGHYIWFDWSGADGGSSGEADTLSVDVSDVDVESVTACADGSIEVAHSQPEPAPVEPDEATTEDLTPVCWDHPATLTYYCTLPNRTLVIS